MSDDSGVDRAPAASVTAAATGWRFGRGGVLLALVCAVLGLLVFSGGAGAVTLAGAGGPWVATDQPDYPPAANVALTGGGWQPGEPVHVVVNDDEGQTWSYVEDVTADETGGFSLEFTLPDSFVATYSVTATGADAGGSGTATTSFTDAIGGDASNSGDRGSTTVSSSSSVTLSKPSNTTSNDFLLAAVTVRDLGTASICAPAGWTAVRTAQTSGTTTSVTQQLFWRRAASTDSSYTFSFRSSCPSGTSTSKPASAAVVRYTWVVDSTGGETGIDVAAGQSGTGNSFTAPSVATTVARDRVINVYGSRNSSSISNVDFSTSCSSCSPTAVEDFQQAAAGATPAGSASGTASSDVWVGQTVALKAKPALLNGQAYANGSSAGALTVAPGAKVPLALSLTATPSETWAASKWTIDGSSGCVDHTDHTAGTLSSTNTEYFDATAPTTAGTYDVAAKGFTNGSCTQGGSETSARAGKVVVDGSTLFSDYFGSGVSQDVLFWKDENQVDPDDCSVTGAIEFNYYVALSRGCTVSTTNLNSVPINTAGRQNIHVRFTWGKNIDPGFGGSLDLYWKLASSGTWLLACQTGQNSCSHTVSNIGSGIVPATENAVDVTLPAAANNVSGAGNDSIDIRFKGNTDCRGSGSGSCDVIRVDGVRVSGDPLPPAASTALTQVSGSGAYGGSATLTATLKAGATPIDGATVAFTLNGTSVGSAQTQSNGVATLNNVSLAGIDAGTYANAVGASFAGDSGNAASNGTGDLTVGKAPASLAFVAADLGQTYDGSAKSVAVTTSPSGLSGVSVSYSQSGNAVASPTDAGSYKVDASLDNPNYEASAITGTLVIERANQTINVTSSAPASKPYGGSFTVAASASSGLPVAYGSSGSCSNSGAGFTMTSGSGTCTVTYDQTGNNNYKPAPQITENVTATKAPASLAFVAADLGQTYDGSARSVGVTTTPSGLSGVSVSYSQNGNAVATPTDAGSYKVDASLDNANYEASAITGTLVIERASQTINVTSSAPASKPYGGSFTVAASASSGLPVAYGSSGSCSNSGAGFTMTSGSGTCTVTYDQNGNTNYKPATQITENVTATKAPLTVKADDKAMTYADPVPPLTYGITGFVNGETLATSGVIGVPALATTATSSSQAGSYPITVGLGTLSSANYGFV